MGCVNSSHQYVNAEDESAREKSSKIDLELEKERKVEAKRTKILMLGAGESGKTTILKRIRKHAGYEYTMEEKEDYRDVLWQNAIQSMQAILEAVKTMQLHYSDSESKQAAHLIYDLDLPGTLDTYISIAAPAINLLWAQAITKQVFSRSREYQLNDSAAYLFDLVPQMSSPTWLPSADDCLRARVKTVGVNEVYFQMKDHPFRFFDCGGQKSERRKWISAFEGVDMLLFVVAISEYDQTLYEDNVTSRWQDAETLYDATINSQWLASSTLILFLNKLDIFTEKLTLSPLSTFFDDFPAGDDASVPKAASHLSKRLEKFHKKRPRYFKHYTCAVDNDKIRIVIDAVVDTALMANLKSASLL